MPEAILAPARRAESSDAPELVRLRRLMFEAMGQDASDHEWEAVAIDLVATEMHAGRLCAAVVDAPEHGLAAGGIVQFEARLPSPGRPFTTKGYISSMCTDPTWQRNGLATQIFRLLMAECQDRGVAVIELYATPSGRPLYEKFGYTVRTGSPAMQWVDRRPA
jgi:ribosomal protein S18 acetylase RimI-like enzyme